MNKFLSISRIIFNAFLLMAAISLQSYFVEAQTTEFSYQGSLKNGGVPANGNYDMQFFLYTTSAGGTFIASATRLNIPVVNGIFNASLDFGGDNFGGQRLYLEVAVRPAGSGSYTPLAPRQEFLSTPYAIRSYYSQFANNANILGGIGAAFYVLTGDPRMADARNPLPNSPNYIQNSTTAQSTANFNISGNGTLGGTMNAAIVNAATRFDLNGQRILSNAGSFNLFAGVGAGASNTGGSDNAFFGRDAGFSNLSGSSNAFFGTAAGFRNTTGSGNTFVGIVAGRYNISGSNNAIFGYFAGAENTTGENGAFFGKDSGKNNTIGNFNSFFGKSSGERNTEGNFNAFFGADAGLFNTTGNDNSIFGTGAGRNNNGANNSFFGRTAGTFNTNGNSNSFFGASAGRLNETGNENAFFGLNAGFNNTLGSNNTAIGANADVGVNNLTNAAAIGWRASVAQSNALVLGSINGVNGALADTNVGIGTTTPGYRLDVADRVRIKQASGNTGGNNSAGIFFFQNTPGNERAFVGMENDNSVGFFGVNGGGWSLVMNTETGRVKVVLLGAAGSTQLCRNASNEISTCSSSARYKNNINSFSSGLDLVRKLRPVSFNWKDGGMADMGLVAEEVNAVEPLLTTTNDKGEVEGVKYDRVGVVLVNAVNEQQTQLDEQRATIERQQREIEAQREIVRKQQAELDALKQLVCSQNPTAALCVVKQQ